MKKITLLISALVLSVGMTFAQNGRVAGPLVTSTPNTTQTPTTRTCGTMDNVSQEQLDAFQDWLAPKVASYLNQQAMGGSPDAIYTIPTIVHIIHNSNEAVGSGRNIPLARVTEQLQILNDDFRRTNADATNTPTMFQGIAADCEINFCPVTVYPSNHPNAGSPLAVPGVDRVDATTIGLSNTTSGYSTTQVNGTIKPATSWNPNEVMNIWVCQLQSGLLGYAQFPNSGAANTDGTVMGYQYFGNTTSTPFHLGRTTTHEVGHWVGLRHINGDANCGNDFVADTPTQSALTNGCPNHPRPSCSNSGDMFQNYMDYSNDNCMNIFSAGQKAVMQNVMATASRRSTLSAFSSTLCGAAPLNANFTESATLINAGQTITFTDGSGGPNAITTWAWNFDVGALGGVTPATASTQGTHVVTYNTPGVYSVSLVAGDGVGNDTRTKTSYITVQATGSSICDSTGALWDWNTEAYGAAYWGAESPAICTGATSGAIVGNNCYDDNGWASKVPSPGTGKELTDVLYLFVTSQGTGAAALKVWDDGGAGGSPNTVLFNQATTTGAFSANLNQLISVPVSPAVAITGDFFIGYDHASTPVDGDSLVMGIANGTAGNQTWANETGGWIDLSAYNVDYKGTVIAVVCDVSTGEKELLGDLTNIMVYPNPSIGTINIALTEKVNSTVSIYNMLGEEVFTTTKNTQMFNVDMNNQPNGVYFVKIKSGDAVTTKKVILSK
jgi:PKD repeat protein